MLKSDTIGKLVDALAKAQDEFNPIIKAKDNPFFKSKYADLAAGIEATQPSLVKNGLVISQFPINQDARIGVLSILAHTSGEYIAQEYTLPIAKQDAQTGVAGVTYARRAARLAIIDVAAEDDDGNTATGRKVDDWKEPSAETMRKALDSTAEDRAEIAQTAKTPVTVVEEKTTVTYKQVQPVETLAEAGIPTGGPIPSPEQLDAYTNRLKTLRVKLQEEGKLKPAPNLSAPRKLLHYVLKVTDAPDLKQISVVQWDSFFAFAEKMDPVALVKLINGGNTK